MSFFTKRGLDIDRGFSEIFRRVMITLTIRKARFSQIRITRTDDLLFLIGSENVHIGSDSNDRSLDKSNILRDANI